MVAYLGHAPRAEHSRLVARIMRAYACRAGRDADPWQSVGLLHDLDYRDTLHRRGDHGLVAAKRLRELLPQEALTAIAAHDHRTAVSSDSELSQALRSADASASLCECLGEQQIHGFMAEEAASFDRLRGLLPGREYLADLLEAYSRRSGMSVFDLLRILTEQNSANPPGL